MERTGTDGERRQPPRTPFVMVPLWVALHDAVRPSATLIRVYVALLLEADYAKRITRTTPTKLMRATDLSRSTVYRDLATLRSIGALAERRDGSVWLPLDPPDPESTQVDEPGSASSPVDARSTTVDSESTVVDEAVLTEIGSRVSLREDPPSASPPMVSGAYIERLFDQFWDAYPRRTAKADARRAWAKACRVADPAEVIEAARRYAADPNLPEMQFVPHPATWLNGGRWSDGPLPARGRADGQPGGGPRVALPRRTEGPSGRIRL